MSENNLQLYDYPVSGHAHRIRNFLSILGVEYQKNPINMREGEHKAPEYLNLSPLGQVPTLVDGDLVMTDSTEALVYLALQYGDERWLPRDPAGAAKVQRWLSAASAEVYRGPVLARAGLVFGRDVDMERAKAEATRLFDWMQSELADRTWLAAEHATIADIAVYTYVRVADEGGLSLDEYPAIQRWLGDVEQLDGFEAMPRSGNKQ
jgi:glutathione S-transferase